MQPRSFLIVAKDAVTFRSAYPDVHASIIDTSINLPNAAGTISIIDSKGKTVDAVEYSASLGGAGNGDSLQHADSNTWIEAGPTPGSQNAQIAAPVVTKAPIVTAKKLVAKKKSQKQTTQKANRLPDRPGIDPVQPDIQIDDTSDAAAETAAAGAASKGSMSQWFLGAFGMTAAAAAIAFVAARSKKDEWEILEETD